MYKKRLLLTILAVINICNCANILMITMGGTKSHKMPFWELSRGLIPRGHNVTLISSFSPDFFVPGLEELAPETLVRFVKNFTNWDLVGARMRGEEPVHPWDIIRYPHLSCEAMLSDPEMQEFLNTKTVFDLIIIDGSYPECSLVLPYHFKKPFIYINTVGFYTFALSLAGNPQPYSVLPFLALPYTDKMNVFQRTINTLWHMTLHLIHDVAIEFSLYTVLKKHFGPDIPSPNEMGRNVSFILQNTHWSLTYARPFLPNVAEIACIHCRPAKPLPHDLEDFVQGAGDAGFIFVSMGSSVKAHNNPDSLRRMFLLVFKQLPQRVLWKWETGNNMTDLPDNVKIGEWMPQQDILGHPKLKAFVTHGGLLSMFETVYHGVPIVTMPVFCDHDANAAKAEDDGYAIKLELATLTAETLLWSIKKIINDPKYRMQVKKTQEIFNDQKEGPLERAIFWTEYVIRHKGAPHLQSPARYLNSIQYYLIDVVAIIIICVILIFMAIKWLLTYLYRLLVKNVKLHIFKKAIKME